MSVLSDARIKRIKTIKPNEFDDKFIRDFSTKWNIARKLVEIALNRYEELYLNNKDFKDYVDRYMRNKDIALKKVLTMKQIQLVGDMCEGECDKCPCVDCDEHPEYKRKQRAIRLQNQIRHHEF